MSEAKRTAGRLEIVVENGDVFLLVDERRIRCYDLFAAEQMHDEIVHLNISLLAFEPGGAVELAREALEAGINRHRSTDRNYEPGWVEQARAALVRLKQGESK